MPIKEQGATRSGPVCTSQTVIKDKDDNIVVGFGSRQIPYIFDRYDAWRTAYCHAHRKDNLRLDFRLGKVGIPTLVYAVVIKLKEAIKWHK